MNSDRLNEGDSLPAVMGTQRKFPNNAVKRSKPNKSRKIVLIIDNPQ